MKGKDMDEILTKLQAICGPQYVTNEYVDLLAYRRDCGPSTGGIPGYVCRPKSTDEIVQIVKLANEIKKPLFLWGRATTFVDNGVMNGCIVLALDLMNSFEIDFEKQMVYAETGTIWHAIDGELKKYGWELAAPGGGGMFSATVGGTIAYNAVPHGITEYGMVGDHVISMEVVLPDGTIVHTGSAANDANGNKIIERGANGPDLAGLFIGSCGTLGIITKAALQIRRIPEAEDYLFYTFEKLDDAVDAVSAMQKQEVGTFIIGLFGGPHPTGKVGKYTLHVIIRDSRTRTLERKQAGQTICESFRGIAQDANATKLYWTEHMYSWLRNDGPSTYYGSRPYYCPEVSGFIATQDLKQAIPALNQYIDDTREEWTKHGMAVKGFDVYFSRNGGFLWVDTLNPEWRPESRAYGIKVRRDISELMYGNWMSPGGIVAGIAPYIMPKLGSSYQLMQTLKDALDPHHILNPGVLMLAGDPTVGRIPDHAAPQGLHIEETGDVTFQCLRCGFCFDLSWVGKNYQQCPAYESGKFETYAGRGRVATARAILEGELKYDKSVADRVYSCTLCGSCTEHCFKCIDLRKVYQAMRNDMAEQGLTPAGLKQAAQDTYQQKNPYSKEHADRFSWLKDKSHVDKQAKIALFVGCTPSYVRKSAATEAVSLLDKMGVDYTISSEEWCCGHPLMSAGEAGKAAEFMRHNIETYQKLGVEKMLFLCPGCQMTFTNELPEVLGEAMPFKPVNIVELVAEELQQGHISLKYMPAGTVMTYHDPCTLGRQLKIYDAPRTILEALPGSRFVEMPRNKRDSFCCGSGSYVRYDFPELTDTAGMQRWQEAVGTKANMLVTSCISCMTEFQQVKSQTKDRLEVVDLISLVNKQVVVRETVK
jgi:Fe-S oxidoreductase/FAD/FMN-containing dehydrogenase